MLTPGAEISYASIETPTTQNVSLKMHFWWYIFEAFASLKAKLFWIIAQKARFWCYFERCREDKGKDCMSSCKTHILNLHWNVYIVSLFVQTPQFNMKIPHFC